jgi:hypothetical protein
MTGTNTEKEQNVAFQDIFRSYTSAVSIWYSKVLLKIKRKQWI